MLSDEERKRVAEISETLDADDDAHATYDADVDGCWGNDDHPLTIAYRAARERVHDASYYKQRDLLRIIDRLKSDKAVLGRADELLRETGIVKLTRQDAKVPSCVIIPDKYDDAAKWCGEGKYGSCGLPRFSRPVFGGCSLFEAVERLRGSGNNG